MSLWGTRVRPRSSRLTVARLRPARSASSSWRQPVPPTIAPQEIGKLGGSLRCHRDLLAYVLRSTRCHFTTCYLLLRALLRAILRILAGAIRRLRAHCLVDRWAGAHSSSSTSLIPDANCWMPTAMNQERSLMLWSAKLDIPPTWRTSVRSRRSRKGDQQWHEVAFAYISCLR